MINKFNNIYITPNYFYVWLSGFLEIKGIFNIKIKKGSYYYYSFSLEHSNDYYIIYNLYKLYNIKVKIKNIKNMSYLLKTYKKDALNKVISHCISYPLQGEKSILINQYIRIFFK